MKNNANSSALRSTFKGFFTKNLALKIASVIFAMLLWGYVMMSEDPERTKTINDVTVSFDGESDLIARKLVVRGDRSEFLKKVTVRVKTALTKYSDLSADDVVATISLRNISKAGEYELEIKPTTPEGSIQSITPGKATIEIDNLVTRRIPVETVFTGALPEGYWASAPALSRAELEIEGAATDLANINKAQCVVSLDGRTQSFNESIIVNLVNSDGTLADSSDILGQLPSVSVKMDILATKTVPMNVADAILGKDSIPPNYEIAEIRTEPAMVRIAGAREALDTVNELTIEELDISGRTESLLEDVLITPIEGIRFVDGDTVSVYVGIREQTDEAEFTELPINVRGAGKRVNVSVLPNTANVTLTGRTTLISILKRTQVELYVDVTGLTDGKYQLSLMVDLSDDNMLAELSWLLSVEKATVIISGAQG